MSCIKDDPKLWEKVIRQTTIAILKQLIHNSEIFYMKHLFLMSFFHSKILTGYTPLGVVI